MGMVVFFQIAGRGQNFLTQFSINLDITQRRLPRTFSHNAQWFTITGVVGPYNNKGVLELNSGDNGSSN